MSTRLRQHGLSLFFAAIFLASLIAQSLVGLADHNAEQQAHDMPTVTWAQFVTSSAFAVDVAENWQSEFLQFFLFILATVWLTQKGSPESKEPGDEGTGTDADQLVGPHARPDSPAWARATGLKLWLFSNSLLLVMGSIFVLSWLAQGIAGARVYNDEQAEHGEPAISVIAYFATSEFWNRTLQNWQSEFLAVGCMVTFSIFLRQRGSAESKPVGAPHSATSVTSE